MRTLLVVAHPRRSSLTFSAAEAFADAIGRRGHVVEWADLVAEKFDPVLMPPDEPDWNDPKKLYSDAVRAEIRRIERNESTVLMFPVWWWSVPAILKGWIDRVWNHGWAYGTRFYPHRRVWMIGIAAGTPESYAKHRYDVALRTQLETGVLEYCGVAERRVELLYASTMSPPAQANLLARALALGLVF